jgi:hypothetical protein
MLSITPILNEQYLGIIWCCEEINFDNQITQELDYLMDGLVLKSKDDLNHGNHFLCSNHFNHPFFLAKIDLQQTKKSIEQLKNVLTQFPSQLSKILLINQSQQKEKITVEMTKLLNEYQIESIS